MKKLLQTKYQKVIKRNLIKINNLGNLFNNQIYYILLLI
jgi:hypothetical protein